MRSLSILVHEDVVLHTVVQESRHADSVRLDPEAETSQETAQTSQSNCDVIRDAVESLAHGRTSAGRRPSASIFDLIRCVQGRPSGYQTVGRRFGNSIENVKRMMLVDAVLVAHPSRIKSERCKAVSR
jgi:hypothetical protein